MEVLFRNELQGMVTTNMPNVYCKGLFHRHSESNIEYLRPPTNTIADLYIVAYLYHIIK